MDKQQVKEFVAKNNAEAHAVSQFLASYQQFRANTTTPMAAFDSVSATKEVALPSSLATLFDSSFARSAGVDKIQQAVFDGLENGINEYKRRHGGDTPSNTIIQAAFDSVANTFTSKDERTQDALAKMIGLDSANLTADHHAPMGIVPAMVLVTMMNSVANALPIVAQLPNPNGSQVVPLVFGKSVANKRWGAMNQGDDIDGKKSGLPYLENRYTLLMTKENAKFSTPVHIGLTPAAVNGKRNVYFTADKATDKAPFLGGAVVVLINGTPVADDRHTLHETKSGISNILPIKGQAVEVWDETTQSNKKFYVKSGRADLDNHTIEVEFDDSNGNHIPDDKMVVEVEVVFDYERKNSTGQYILTPPGIEMEFFPYEIYARPSRSDSVITIDALTQMQNELNIPWQAAVLSSLQQKYMVEQNSRLLREAANAARLDPKRTTTHSGYKAGVQNTTLADKVSDIIISIGKGKAALANRINEPVAGVDVFVGIETAPLFNALPADSYTPTGISYGDNSSIYRIGKLNDGTNVYYVPQSFGVTDAPDGLTFTGLPAKDPSDQTKDYWFLTIPKVTVPAKAPFIGHTAVAPMVNFVGGNGSGSTMYEQKIERYARVAAEHNPNPRYRHQVQIVELQKMPIV